MKPEKIIEFFKEKGLNVAVKHFHPNTDAGARIITKHLGIKYRTIATISDENGQVIVQEIATCAPGDQPVRRVGYSKALGRAYATYIRVHVSPPLS